MRKKFLTGILAGLMAFGTFGNFEVEAATRAEISAVQVKKSGNFKYWNKDAAAVTALKDYMKDITDKKSKNFIPVEDRIAVFDMDGTFLCETAPYYFDHMIFLHRALYDETYTASSDDREFAADLENWLRNKGSNENLGSSAPHQASIYEGMTNAQFKSYVQDFMNKTPVEGLTNLKWGEAFYLPMVEVIKYLRANDFTVYVVSGTDREMVRVLVEDILPISPNNIIGSDIKIIANNQGDKDGLNYTFNKNDYLVRGEFTQKDLQMNKVANIAQEIGKQPVLAFGNSSGDTSMINYTITDNKYKSLGFFVLCDDLERELGNTSKAAKCDKLAKDNGWISISMKDDWKTIYGENVRRN